MKKLLKLIVSTLVVLTLSMVVVACGGKDDDKPSLAAPTALSLDNMVLSWDEVEGATGYEVSVDGTNYTEVEEAEVNVETIVTSTSVTKLYVRAIDGEVAEFPVVVTKLATPNKPRIEVDPTTKSEKFVWDKVTDAQKYLIKVNDGKWVVSSTAQFSTTESGTYVLTVKCKSYSDDNYIYLESDPSAASDTLDLLVGSTLMQDVIHTLTWDVGEFDSFNLWVDGVKAAEDIMPGEYDEELEGYTGFNFVEEGVITKTGEYDIQLECIKGERSAWSNVLTEVGTALINDKEICSFDNRRLVVNNVNAAALTSISSDVKRGEKGASLRLESSVQVNLNLNGQYVEQLNMHTLEEISYWVYFEKPEDSTAEGASFDNIPKFCYDSWEVGNIQRFNPKNLTWGQSIPWNTWTEIRAFVHNDYDTTLIIKYNGTGVVYIDDIYYVSTLEEPENAEELELTSNKAVIFVKNNFACSYQRTTINLGAEFGGRNDVFVTMDLYVHTNETEPFGFMLYSWQDGDLNTSGNQKGLPIGFAHYRANSADLEIGQWQTITFKARPINANGDFMFSPGCYADTTLGFTDAQATYWIYVKNVTASVLGDVTKSGETGLKVTTNQDFDAIELYVNGSKVKDDISDDLVDDVYDLVTAGYITSNDDYFCSVKVAFVKDGETLLTTSDIIFEKLSNGVQVGYNPDGVEPWTQNKDLCRAIVVDIDNTKFDDKDATTQYVNVTMEMKGVVGKNSKGESATGGMYIRAYDWGIADGKIKGDPSPLKGAANWLAAYTATEWTTIQVRLPKTSAIGEIYLVPFAYPTGFSITVFVRNITVDYTTLNDSATSPVQYMENVGSGEVVGTVPAGTKDISVSLDKSKFATDGTLQWVNISMKVRGTIGQGADGSTCTGGIYMRAYEWGGFESGAKIKEDPFIVEGASSWFEACSSTEWKEITIRVPKRYGSTGQVRLHLFGYPTAYPISMEVKDIVVDYDTLSEEKTWTPEA